MSLVPSFSIIEPWKATVEVTIQLERQSADFWRAWHQYYEEKYAREYPIENVKFEHNPNWRNEFWSLTCAREGNHPAWKGVRILFGLAGVI